MPPRQRPTCLVCQHQASKYSCASCRADYCSVACYKQHKETCSASTAPSSAAGTSVRPVQPPPPPHSRTSTPSPRIPDLDASQPDPASDPSPEPLQDPPRLRPLTALKWPYVPEASAYPDPLTRDDPKQLQLHQYEAIATSTSIRTILRSNPRLRDLLTSIDALRGSDREEALQRALGVDRSQLLKNDDAATPLDEDTIAFRELAQAVEASVRGGREDILGLDWDQASNMYPGTS